MVFLSLNTLKYKTEEALRKPEIQATNNQKNVLMTAIERFISTENSRPILPDLSCVKITTDNLGRVFAIVATGTDSEREDNNKDLPKNINYQLDILSVDQKDNISKLEDPFRPYFNASLSFDYDDKKGLTATSEVWNIGIPELYQKLGLGREIMLFWLEITSKVCRTLNVNEKIEKLDAINPKNNIPFYENLGYDVDSLVIPENVKDLVVDDPLTLAKMAQMSRKYQPGSICAAYWKSMEIKQCLDRDVKIEIKSLQHKADNLVLAQQNIADRPHYAKRKL